MDNMNFDANTLNKLKNMINNGDLNDVISQIPPEMIQNFSSMMNNSSNKANSDINNHSSNFSSDNGNSKKNNSFDFSNIDMNTVLKMKSVMEKLNNSNDPRSNLLYSLKPYLRDGKKEKLDQYANLLNVAKIADLLKNENNNSNNNNNNKEKLNNE